MPAKTAEKRPRRERTENAARRRRQLVEATIDSVVEHGMSATTLATVSERAGLSQGVAVFYFKSKQGLLAETLTYHYEEYRQVWKTALEAAPDDPVERILALVLADLDKTICTRRHLAMWNSFWGEAKARPVFAEICDRFDSERDAVLTKLCADAADLVEDPAWSPKTIALALDNLTDGMWIRMHISPGSMSLAEGRDLLVRFLASVMPSRRDQIMRRAAKTTRRKSA